MVRKPNLSTATLNERNPHFSLTEPTEITDAGVYRGVESNLMRFPIAAVTLLATTFAVGMPQSPFVGKWQTRISRVTKKSAITVNIVQDQQKVGGTVVLVNPDASEIELPILNVKVTDKVIGKRGHGKRGQTELTPFLRRQKQWGAGLSLHDFSRIGIPKGVTYRPFRLKTSRQEFQITKLPSYKMLYFFPRIIPTTRS
ncbi:MAG TPA: hypothetical protein VGS78_06650 [Candidatus Sulfotelmatobacter sp.]|nr:hypothetical protein [Candidatus Sulfotelmatobacter sp.]